MYGTKEEIIAHLNEHWSDDDIMAVSIWVSDDVTYCHEEWAENFPMPTTPAHFKAVLEYFSDNEDASVGLNWDSLRVAIEEVMDEFADDDHYRDVMGGAAMQEGNPLTGDPDVLELLQEDGSIEDFKDVG